MKTGWDIAWPVWDAVLNESAGSENSCIASAEIDKKIKEKGFPHAEWSSVPEIIKGAAERLGVWVDEVHSSP